MLLNSVISLPLTELGPDFTGGTWHILIIAGENFVSISLMGAQKVSNISSTGLCSSLVRDLVPSWKVTDFSSVSSYFFTIDCFSLQNDPR